MTTIVNTPAAGNEKNGSGATAIIITILILGTLIAVFYFFVLPLLRYNQNKTSTISPVINVTLPTPKSADTPAPQTPSTP